MSDNEYISDNDNYEEFSDGEVSDDENEKQNEDKNNILIEEKISNHNILNEYDITKYNTTKKQPISYNKLTKYEKASIIGIRSQQLTSGAKPLIKDYKNITDVKVIAKMELEQNKIPLIIARPYPDGTTEYWKLEDLCH